MNETTQTEQNWAISVNEEKMYLLIKQYLRHILNEAVPDFQGKHFLALIDTLFGNGKVEAIKYLRSLFSIDEQPWIPSGYNNNKFEEFINTKFSHIKPQQNKYYRLGLKEAKDIVDWIEANRQYTKY